MAIFQPSFVTPDRRNGLGNGTIDATQSLTVSWRVNGPSALQYFGISIYSNDAASTELYTTGKISDGCPFYGTTNTGEIQFFSYTIPAATLSSNGITNGNEYKIIIEQWWNANDSVIQSSASVFVTRATPTVLTEGPLYITSISHTFSGGYTQAQGDSLNWFRWQIERVVSSGDNVTVFDSGEISGTEDISCTFNGFIVGLTYRYQLTIQTENGITAQSTWYGITVHYSTDSAAGYVTATCQGDTSAVKVDFSGINNIPGTANGTYTLSDSCVILEDDSSITWNTVNGEPMLLGNNWYLVLVISNIYENESATFTVEQNNGDTIKFAIQSIVLPAPFSSTDYMFRIYKNETILWSNSYSRVINFAKVLIMQNGVYFVAENTESRNKLFFGTISASEITSISISGKSGYNSVEVFEGTPTQSFIDMFLGSYIPRSAPFYMSATFDSGIGAGVIDSDSLTGYSVYRELQQQNNAQLVPICHTTLANRFIYEYGAKNQTPYRYYVFPESDTQILTQGIISNRVTPCWWNWSLMECQATNDKNIFTVLAEYRFSGNVSTTAMSNNNTPNVLQNFTQYPTVQISPHNYKSGVLQGLIGAVDENASYSDSIALMEKLYALPLSSNPFFLKDRKGHLLRVRISGEITMQTGDANKEQPQTISLPWVEVGSAENVSLWALDSMAQGV